MFVIDYRAESGELSFAEDGVMGLLHWEKRYSVGIDAVDHEHRELVDLVNRLYDKATTKGSKDP